jgi:hypothetical protein
MAFKWTNLVDGKDYVTAEPINKMGQEVEKMSEEMSETKVLFVTITDGVASHTPTEIAECVNNGYSVYLREGGLNYPLSSLHDTSCEFSFMDAEDHFARTWEIGEDGHAELFEADLATVEYLEEAIQSAILDSWEAEV